jgi:hypothetical protein
MSFNYSNKTAKEDSETLNILLLADGRYIPIYIDIYRYIPIYTDIYQYVPIYTDIYQYLPIYTNIYRYIPMPYIDQTIVTMGTGV